MIDNIILTILAIAFFVLPLIIPYLMIKEKKSFFTRWGVFYLIAQIAGIAFGIAMLKSVV